MSCGRTESNTTEWRFSGLASSNVKNSSYVIPTATTRCFEIEIFIGSKNVVFAPFLSIGSGFPNKFFMIQSHYDGIRLLWSTGGGGTLGVVYPKNIKNRWVKVGVKIKTDKVELHIDGQYIEEYASIPNDISGTDVFTIHGDILVSTVHPVCRVRRARHWIEDVDFAEVQAGTEAQLPYTDWQAKNTNSGNDTVIDAGTGLQDGTVSNVTTETIEREEATGREEAVGRELIQQYLQCDLQGYPYADVTDVDFSGGFTLQSKVDFRYIANKKRRIIMGLYKSSANSISFYDEVGVFYANMRINGITSTIDAIDQELLASFHGKIVTFGLSYDNSTMRLTADGILLGSRASSLIVPDGMYQINNIYLQTLSQ